MSNVTGIGALWQQGTMQGGSAAADKYSQMVQKLKMGGDTGGAEEGGEEKVTVQRFLPDGSLLILVMQGDKVVSQTKFSVAQQRAMHMVQEGSGEAAAALVGTAGRNMLDRFNDTSTSIMTGSLFSEGV